MFMFVSVVYGIVWPRSCSPILIIASSYQIVPKFKAYAKENNVSGNFITISTCSAKQSMCTYYMVSL